MRFETAELVRRFLTWAISAGISGIERNTLFDATINPATRTGQVDMTRGLAVCLAPSQGHSTETLGTAPSRHLHLYGRRLADLAPFEDRLLSTDDRLPR